MSNVESYLVHLFMMTVFPTACPSRPALIFSKWSDFFQNLRNCEKIFFFKFQLRATSDSRAWSALKVEFSDPYKSFSCEYMIYYWSLDKISNPLVVSRFLHTETLPQRCPTHAPRLTDDSRAASFLIRTTLLSPVYIPSFPLHVGRVDLAWVIMSSRGSYDSFVTLFILLKKGLLDGK